MGGYTEIDSISIFRKGSNFEKWGWHEDHEVSLHECDICHCVVDENSLEKHATWHETLSGNNGDLKRD